MPISHRTHRLTSPGAAKRESRMIQAWAASVTLIALIVFVASWAATTLSTALTTALVILFAGGVLLTLMFGTAWVTQVRGSTSDPRRRD